MLGTPILELLLSGVKRRCWAISLATGTHTEGRYIARPMPGLMTALTLAFVFFFVLLVLALFGLFK